MIGMVKFMPEGPECRRFALALGDHIGGETLVSFEIKSGRYIKKPMPGLERLNEDLPVKVMGVGVHGKFIYLIFNDKTSLWSTLGMAGSWQKNETKHTRVEMTFESGKKVYFNDMRNFGTLQYCVKPQLLASKLESLGPDLLAQDIDNNVFISQLRKKNNSNITKVLMDQSIVAGIGNYIKSEALWLSRISPHRKVEDLSDSKLSVLNKAVQTIMKESFTSGGATIQSYKDFFGESKTSYSSRFMVYNQKTDPDGNEVKKEKTPDGRTTHWVPKVQE